MKAYIIRKTNVNLHEVTSEKEHHHIECLMPRQLTIETSIQKRINSKREQ
jgi:hypothetical protein